MLNEMAQEFHSLAESKGFWDKERDPLQVLMLIVSEAVEASEYWRDGLPLNETYYSGQKPFGVPSELAEIIIRTLDAAAAWQIDIDEAVRIKYEYNKSRPVMHNREC